MCMADTQLSRCYKACYSIFAYDFACISIYLHKGSLRTCIAYHTISIVMNDLFIVIRFNILTSNVLPDVLYRYMSWFTILHLINMASEKANIFSKRRYSLTHRGRSLSTFSSSWFTYDRSVVLSSAFFSLSYKMWCMRFSAVKGKKLPSKSIENSRHRLYSYIS